MKFVETIEPKIRRSEKKTLRVAIYCRVSTDHDEQDERLEAQEYHYFQMIQKRADWEYIDTFSDRGTGLNLCARPAFRKLLQCCAEGKVDLVLTKSISRFGRNTVDMLKALQTLNTQGVDCFFEKENLWLHEEKLMLVMTAYCAMAQAESEGMSSSIRWGIKRGFERGTSGYADFECYGYKRGDDGTLVINVDEAAVVKQVFEMRAAGQSLGEISDWLYDNHILSPNGKERWSRETIRKLLRNEKYTGDVLLQKTYVQDLFTGKRAANRGELPRYLIEQHHPAIVSRELFETVNSEKQSGITGS